ncbi:SfnB family sulfur acquisition oxidoreductase [Aeromicrobium endophyticum]|uniref:SfnB family sulfur acquisition oxidoreductase n=1 Tax=Aeromicrobium endophyticum TaxID=2292704 RepID=A0A371PFC7_9ACTN|nr:SfnB family sulfur acquisition oxidoreductase [Aeromicrobium endophyticum]
MTVPATPRGVPELLATVRELVPNIVEGAADRDRERQLPREEIDALSATGALAITVPATHGGAGGGASAAFELTRLLATADPNVAQVPQSHFVYLRLVELAGSTALKDEIFAAVLTGERVANAQSERGGRTITDISTRIIVDGSDAVVTGEKFYSTGSLLADWLAVLGRDDDGVDHVGFVRDNTRGVSIVDDWTGMGQRTTASGTITFDDVRLPATHVVPRSEAVTGPYGYGALAQGLHAAIDVGIARGALAEASAFVRSSSHPWFEAQVDRAEDDPLLVQRFGELEVEVRAAESALHVAGAAVDHVDRVRTDDAAAEASLQVAAAKVLADRAALAVTNGLFELGGTRASDDRLNLHRHWRNARTHTLHDPIRWKLQHLGRWTVRGERPPRGPQL